MAMWCECVRVCVEVRRRSAETIRQYPNCVHSFISNEIVLRRESVCQMREQFILLLFRLELVCAGRTYEKRQFNMETHDYMYLSIVCDRMRSLTSTIRPAWVCYLSSRTTTKTTRWCHYFLRFSFLRCARVFLFFSPFSLSRGFFAVALIAARCT